MLPPRVATLMDAAGHDATTPGELGAHNLPDEVLVATRGRQRVRDRHRECQRLRCRQRLPPAARVQSMVALRIDRGETGRRARPMGHGEPRPGQLGTLASRRGTLTVTQAPGRICRRGFHRVASQPIASVIATRERPSGEPVNQSMAGCHAGCGLCTVCQTGSVRLTRIDHQPPRPIWISDSGNEPARRRVARPAVRCWSRCCRTASRCPARVSNIIGT
jgi:hypothetical protein